MATPNVTLRADVPDSYLIVVCECGDEIVLDAQPTLLTVLQTVGEHNTAVHLRPDNVGLRIRR